MVSNSRDSSRAQTKSDTLMSTWVLLIHLQDVSNGGRYGTTMDNSNFAELCFLTAVTWASKAPPVQHKCLPAAKSYSESEEDLRKTLKPSR